MVTLAIFTVMTAMVLANYPNFNTRISRDLLVQSVALSIREAQVYGTSIRSDVISAGDGGTVSNAFGMSFWPTGTNNYYLFIDRNGDNLFDFDDVSRCPPYSPDAEDAKPECIGKYAISPGKNKIVLTCGNYKYNDRNTNAPTTRQDCDNAATDPSKLSGAQSINVARKLNIVFHRPNPEATIIGEGFPGGAGGCGGGLYDTGTVNIEGMCSYSNAAIFIGDGVTAPKKVIIWNTGQIATE